MHALLHEARPPGADAKQARTGAADFDHARAARGSESFAEIVEAALRLSGCAQVHVDAQRPVSQLLTSEYIELFSRLPMEACIEPDGDIVLLPALSEEDHLIASLISFSEECVHDFEGGFLSGSSIVLRTGEHPGHLLWLNSLLYSLTSSQLLLSCRARRRSRKHSAESCSRRPRWACPCRRARHEEEEDGVFELRGCGTQQTNMPSQGRSHPVVKFESRASRAHFEK